MIWRGIALGIALVVLGPACGSSGAAVPQGDDAGGVDSGPVFAPAAGFVEVPPRGVTVHGKPVSVATTARIFYSFRPADVDAADRPILFLFNGYAAEIVRAFGTGPTGVDATGAVVPNPTPLTAFANLVYLDPRQSGYSYDLPPPGAPPAPSAEDCSPDIFNEYVDAGDVLLAALSFLGTHPELRGPVYWLGESYGGVRLTWILAYLRGRWDLAPYTDDAVSVAVAAARHPTSLVAGQILLEAWVGGGPEADAIAAVCENPTVAAAVAASAAQSCGDAGACACATMLGLSTYNYTYTTVFQTQRATEAIEAHVDPGAAATLLGVPLESIPELAPAERARGWKCLGPDDTIPSEGALEAALGALPPGQAYYLDYSPLVPGRETETVTLDWQTTSAEALAFVDNLHDVPALLTRGARDLVVPTAALPAALEAAIGASRVDTSLPDVIGVAYADGTRAIAVRDYAAAGHMITMVQPADFAADLARWLGGE